MNIEKKIVALKKLYPLFEKQLKNPNRVLQNKFGFYKFVILYDQVFRYLFLRELSLVLDPREFLQVIDKKHKFCSLKPFFEKRNETNCQMLYAKRKSLQFLNQDSLSKEEKLCIEQLQNIRNLLHGIKDNHVKDQINASNSDWRDFRIANSKVMQLKKSFYSLIHSDEQTSLDVFEKQVAEFFSQYTFLVKFLLKNWENRELMLELFFTSSLSSKSQHFLLVSILYLDLQLEHLLSQTRDYIESIDMIQQRRFVLEIQNRNLTNQ